MHSKGKGTIPDRHKSRPHVIDSEERDTRSIPPRIGWDRRTDPSTPSLLKVLATYTPSGSLANARSDLHLEPHHLAGWVRIHTPVAREGIEQQQPPTSRSVDGTDIDRREVGTGIRHLHSNNVTGVADD